MRKEWTLSPIRRLFFIYFLAAFFVFLLFPDNFYLLPWSGVDGSWAVAIHLAKKFHLEFGRDFVYTYGPLAFLRIRFPIAMSKWVLLLWDTYYLYILFTGFSLFMRQHFRPGPLLFLCCVVFIGQGWEVEKWYLMLLYFFLISFLNQPDRLVYLFHAAVLALLCFYIKVNSGLIDIGILVMVITYAVATKKLSRKTYVLFVASFAATLVLSARLLHTDLLHYLVSSWYLLRDYEDVMYLPLLGKLGESAPWLAAIFFFVLISCYIFVVIKAFSGRYRPEKGDAAITYLLVAAGVFLWYKNGFVRADGGHIFQFFDMAGPLTLFLYVYTPDMLGRKVVAVFCWALLFIAVLSLTILPESPFPGRMEKLVTLRLFSAKAGNIAGYFRGIGEFDRERARIDSFSSGLNAFKNAVGDHTTDIIPTEVSLIYTNGLRYAPRPVIQSYVAYDKYLDLINYNDYLSPRAPDYVFFTLEGTNDRFAWFDESRIKLALLARYQPVTMIGDQLLLKKQDPSRQMIPLREDTVDAEMDRDIPIGKGPGLQFTRILVDRNWWGKLRTFIYQPPELNMDLTLEDGEIRHLRLLKPELEDGIILNKYVNSTQEFRLFLLSDGRINPNVRSVRIVASGVGGYRPKVTMINTWYAFEEKSPVRQLQDSLGLSQLTNNGSPLKTIHQLPSTAAGDPIRYGLEYYHDHAGLIRIAGWAIHEKRDNTNDIIKVMARSGDSVYELPVEKYGTLAFPYELTSRNDLGSAGFLSLFARTQLPPGNYQLGLAIYHGPGDTGSIRYIDKYFDVPAPYLLQRTGRPGDLRPGDIRSNIDTVFIADGKLTIKGWAILPAAAAKTVTNLIFQNDTAVYRVNTMLQRRLDIVGAFRDAGFEYSGFTTSLSTTGGPKGVFRVGIEKLSPDGRTRSIAFTLTEVKLGYPDSYIPVVLDSLPPAADNPGNIDRLQDTYDVATIAGWVMGDTLHARHDLLRIVLQSGHTSYAAAVDRSDRPDVAARFRNKDLQDCGFSVRITKAGLPKGRYRIGIILQQPGKGASVTFFNQYIEKQ